MKSCPICQTQYPHGEIFCPTDGARLVTASQMDIAPQTSDDPLLGVILDGRYKVLRRLGEGGMGLVYESLHIGIEKKVALKVLRDDFSSRPEVVERFRQEAKSASRIGHEHIVDISDFGETPSGQSYFVMEMLVGEDLASLLAREKALAVRRAAKIVVQCCKALGAAHAKGIVHRDMKPENIFMVTREDAVDFVKIVDFGIAKISDVETPGAPGRKLTKTGMIFGTPEYMSPEQAAGKQLDHRVDIYAMGVILYELITGRVPFVGDTFMGVLTQHMFEQPPPLTAVNAELQVAPEIESIIFKALSKSAADRYQTMDEMARALIGALDITNTGIQMPAAETLRGVADPVKTQARGPRVFEPTAATQFEVAVTDPPPQAGEPAKKKNTGMLVGIGALLLVLGIGGIIVAMGANKPTEVVVPPVRPTPPAAINPPQPPQPPTIAQVQPPAAPQMVTVHITTDPAGAEIEVEGRGLVCAASPCDFSTKANETLRVIARKGRATESRQITPSSDFPLELHLAQPAEPAGQRTKRDPHRPNPPAEQPQQPPQPPRPALSRALMICVETCRIGLQSAGGGCPSCSDLRRSGMWDGVVSE